MQGTKQPASPAAMPSSSLALESPSDLQRKPTWAHISFDDGFDLNLGATSALRAADQSAHPSKPTLSTQSFQPTASSKPDTAIPVHPHASSPRQDDKRLSTSPASSNKALPQLPSLFGTAMDTTNSASSARRQPSTDLPSTTTLASPSAPSHPDNNHHARTHPSNDGTRTPKPSSTPKGRPFASPIITAATPQQPNRVDSCSATTTPMPTRPPSGGGPPVWDSPVQSSPPQPVSSADAYTQPIETFPLETLSRAGTPMSHLSGSNWIHDAPGNRSSLGTTSSMPFTQTKRASVLSFQTANSAGFTSADEARTSDREHLADNALPPLDSAAALKLATQPNSMRPWLDGGPSAHTTWSDERSVPGGLPGAFWDEPYPQPATRSVEPAPAVAIQQPSAITTATTKPRSASADVLVDRQHSNNAHVRHVRDLTATTPPSTLSPLNTQSLAPASPSAPISSTTIAPPSDETAQILRRSPEFTPDRRPSEPLLPLDDVPIPPAKDVRAVSPTEPAVSLSSPQGPIDPDLDETSITAAADNVIPPPLPSEAVSNRLSLASDVLLNGPAHQKPVSDYRKKPLANISSAQKAAGLAHLQAQARATKQQVNSDMQMHAPPPPPPSNPPPEAPPIPILERARRKSNASLTANVALAQATTGAPGMPRDDPNDRSDTPSAESVSQESSAPPDGEVEARAEWERRRRMKRKNEKKQPDVAKPQKSRSDGFQLKPLQLVPADNLTSFASRNGASSLAARGDGVRSGVATGDRVAGALAPAPADPSKHTYSTQQLQKLQAREQRRSVGAFSAAMAAANVASSGSNVGPYPVFASPNTAPQKMGSRQYPGLMAQRSLVPPFELQHRPDGLPSGLIGPDGVRRSLNDPEVCLECMMRDEDMVDIRVVGEGIWERESDKDFEEAVRLEAEEEAAAAAAAANGNSFIGPSGSSGHGDSISSHLDSRGSRRPRKRIGKGEALTVERLKLHTQMNPPASSFRWRTLQTFLAVQAKYIAMEQQRMRIEADKKARHYADSVSSRGSMIVLDASASAPAQQPDRGLSSPFAPPREASVAAAAVSRQSMLQTSTDDSGLTPQQKQEKERDIAAAQAARKKMTLGASAPPPPLPTTTPPLGYPAYPVTPLQTRTFPKTMPFGSGSDLEEQLSGSALAGGVSTSVGGRRVPFGSAQAARAASVQDLRSAADSARAASAGYPASPADSLMPPSRSFAGTSPTGTPSRLASRSGASQLSLMNSGSMIDMHVAQEDRAEHRLNQNGFLPATPLGVASPATLNRSFYGFPGDGDSSVPDATAFKRSRMVSSDGYVNPMEAGPRGLETDGEESSRRKKKGLRGLLSKLTGSSGALSRDTPTGAAADGSLNGSIASRNASKRSQGSGAGSPRFQQGLSSVDRSLDAVSPPLNGMLSKSRMSTSSSFRNGADGDAESKGRTTRSGSTSLFQNPPGMASQNSLDLGPFQPASPQASAIDSARMRRAPNAMMEKYMNSPSLQTLASPVPGGMSVSQPSPGSSMAGERMSVHPSDARNGRMSSFASMRELRTPALQSIPDSEQHEDEADARKSMRFSGASANSRKALPSTPPAAGERDHQRSATGGMRSSVIDSSSSLPRSPGLAPTLAMTRQDGSGPADAGRASMQASRGMRSAPSEINLDTGNMTIPDDASVSSAGPARPPRNPRRPDGVLNSPSFVNGGHDALAPSRRDFPMQGRSQSEAYTGVVGSPASPEKSKKSIFRLPFGRKKRESTFGASVDSSKPSIVIGGADEFDQGQAVPSRSIATFLPKLRTRKSYSGLGVSRASFQTERQRVLSSPAPDPSLGRLPPRSQSAFSMAPAKRFMSMDIPRRSMNVGRGSARNRLSTVQYGEDEDEEEEEDEDDEMECEPGYEAEFNRYAQEAAEERYLNTGSRGGKDMSFGRKSLNLLREGILRTVSSDQKKQR